MEIAQLRAFLLVYESGSFSKAAKAMYLSRQGLSKAVHLLESELNCVLFSREGNALLPTAAGVRLYNQASVAIAKIDEITRDFAVRAPVTDQIRVTLSADVVSLFPNFNLSAFSDFDVKLTEHSLRRCMSDLESGAADVGIIAAMSSQLDNFETCELCRMPVMYIVGDATFPVKPESIKIRDLSGLDVLLLADKELVYVDFLAKYRKLGLGERHLHTITDPLLMRELVLRGRAVGMADEQYCRNLPVGLYGVKSDNNRLNWYLYAVFSNRCAKDERVTALVASLKKVIQGNFCPCVA